MVETNGTLVTELLSQADAKVAGLRAGMPFVMLSALRNEIGAGAWNRRRPVRRTRRWAASAADGSPRLFWTWSTMARRRCQLGSRAGSSALTVSTTV